MVLMLWKQQHNCNSSGCRAAMLHGNLRVNSSRPGQSGSSSGHASLADILLPLTNFSVVSTAALLDAAGGRVRSSAEKRELVQGHQDLYCRCA
jgi:hypothetical protein